MKHALKPQSAPAHDAYPLRTVAALTGLTPDLIRAWEKRYAVVAPIRGARGARLYSADDVDHLRLLARVVGAGRAIGDVAALSRRELGALVQRTPPGLEPRAEVPPAVAQNPFVTRLVERLAAFDEPGAARLLGDAVVALGARAFVHDVAVPLLHHVGALWAEGRLSIAAEHLLTTTLRALISGLMQRRPSTGAVLLLATPTGERHELGLLLLAFLALDAGVGVVRLGAELPAAEIALAAERCSACVVGSSVVDSGNRVRAAREIEALQAALPARVELWLGGADARYTAAETRNFRGLVLDDLEAAENELARVAASTPPELPRPKEARE